MRKQICVVGVGFALLSQLSGCAGVFNPHVHWERSYVGTDGIRRTPSMDEAFAYADGAIDEYKRAMGNNATLESSSGLAFLALSAGAVGSAATGGNQNDVAWLGVAGGSAFGLGTWLTNKPRRTVYAAGVGAMTCAKQAMLPYKISKGDFDRFTVALDALASLLPGVRAVDGAEKRAESYESIVRSGDALRAQLDQSAELLITTVDRIGGEVDKALVSTTADLSALQGLIEGIAGGYGQVDSPETPPTVTTEVEALIRDVAPTAGVVTTTAICTDAQTCAQIVQSTIRRFGASLPLEGLKACGVSESIVAPLAIKPNALIEIKAADGSVDRRLLEGGSGRYVASLLTDKTGAPVIRQPVPLGAQIEVTVTKDTPDGRYQAVVVDAASERKVFFEIVVTN